MHRRRRGLVALATVALVAVTAPAAAATPGPLLRVDATGYVPAAYDPAIPEYPRKDHKNWDFGNPDLGGILTIVVANDGEAADVTRVTVDGVPLETFLAGTCQLAGLACAATPPQEMAWARWLPGPTIPRGGAAVFQLKRTTTPASTTIGIEAGGAHLDVVPSLTASPIRLGLAYRDGDDAIVVVRNDGSAPAAIAGVRLGAAAAPFVTLGGQAEIGPGRTAILRLPGAAPAEGIYAALTVATSAGSATAGVRLFTPFFPIGTWLAESSWYDAQFMADVRAHHIDTSWGYDWTVPLARQHGLRLIADAVPCTAGQTSGCVPEDLVAAYAYGDEVEFGHSAQEVLAKLELRRTASTRPTYINDAAQRVFQVFAGQADIGSMDHYTSGIGLCTITTGQPSSMQGQPLEWAGNYTRQLKLNVEPNPAWVWSQAGNKKNPANSCWHGLPTVGEMQAQLFSELANGAKGITWFTFGTPDDISAAPELWDEAARLGATLETIRGWLGRGDLDPGALKDASASLEVGVVAAPDAVVVPVLDLAYASKPKGYAWAIRSGVQVSVALPAWLEERPIEVSQVRAGAVTAVPFARGGDVVTAFIPALEVGTILVIRPVEEPAARSR